MKIEQINENGVVIALVSGDELIITDTQSTLDLVMSVKYETGADRIVLDKKILRKISLN